MRKLRLAVTCGALMAGAAISQPANATAALIFAGTGAVSYWPTGALAGAAAKAKDKVTSRILAGGSVLIGLADPPAATFYDGVVVNHYDPSLMSFTGIGWFGSWGADPALPGPPADPTTWSDPMPLNVQAPNPALMTSVTNDPVAGVVTTTFSWGPGGHADVDGPFNFLAAIYTMTQPAILDFAGSGPNGAPPDGANLFASTPGVLCSLPNQAAIQPCGEPTTDYYRVSSIPEPGSAPLLLAGGLVLAVALRFDRVARGIRRLLRTPARCVS